MICNNRFARALFFCTLPLVGCSGGSSGPTCPVSISAPPAQTGNLPNVMTVTVNGSLCNSTDQYPNEPCTSITLCVPGTQTCQTIGGILVDTGSFGLRLFKSVVTLNLPYETASGTTSTTPALADCANFGDGSSEWGAVALADIQLGSASETASNVPIQLIDYSFAPTSYNGVPNNCDSSVSSPDLCPVDGGGDVQGTGFNGILGVGAFQQDCGASCVSSASNGQYFSCTASGSSINCPNSVAVPLTYQVQNPVAFLSKDNNGVILNFPSVAAAGATSLTGTLTLGIGTQSNNQPSGLTAYAIDSNDADSTFGNFTTTFTAYSPDPIGGFIDSGSSLFFFPTPTQQPLAGNMPDCSTIYGQDYEYLYCPSTTQNITPTNQSFGGGTSAGTTLPVSDGYTLLNSGNMVLGELASTNIPPPTGPAPPPTFDYGLPYFYGRSIATGIEGMPADGSVSSFGTGPYFAFQP